MQFLQVSNNDDVPHPHHQNQKNALRETLYTLITSEAKAALSRSRLKMCSPTECVSSLSSCSWASSTKSTTNMHAKYRGLTPSDDDERLIHACPGASSNGPIIISGLEWHSKKSKLNLPNFKNQSNSKIPQQFFK